jgi:hypothetical protein
MATHNFTPRMVELKISTQAPNSNPNPSEDHEADGLCLAKIGLESVSIIHQIMIDLDMLPQSTAVPPTLPLETKVVRTPQSGSPINQPVVMVRWMLRVKMTNNWVSERREREVEVEAIGANCRRNLRLTS